MQHAGVLQPPDRLRITFVCPPLNMSGGIRVAVIQAQGLARMGHTVRFVAPPPPRPSLRDRLRLRWQGKSPPAYLRQPPSHLDGSGLAPILLDRYRAPGDADVPDGDVVIATWWETAEWVARLSPSKGAKVYFVQHHEILDDQPLDRVRATYCLPLHKIVIARWLLDVMREEYGDRNCTLVPNSVDHRQFHAAPRGRAAPPSVGLMYSNTPFKGISTALEAIRRAQAQIGPIRVHTFMSHRCDDLPADIDFASIEFNPPQDRLREIYARCDVWLTASVSEGFNLPAMEAMACRTPVVATRTGWPAEAIRDGVNGYLCEVGDADQLAAALVAVLRQTPEQWRAMSEAAWQTVKDSTWTRSVEAFEAGLLHAIERRRNGEL